MQSFGALDHFAGSRPHTSSWIDRGHVILVHVILMRVPAEPMTQLQK
jgi:hypothetical protein